MRCFVAIELPEEIKEILFSIQKKIGNEFAKVKWIAKKNLHLTLKFLGDVDEKQLLLVKEALKNIKFKPFETHLDKLGWFPSNIRVNILWVGLEPENKIMELQGDLELKLGSLFRKDEQFSVHLTIGRVKHIKNKEMFINLLKGIEVEHERFLVNGLSLIKSDLTKDGPTYAVIERYSLY